MHYTVHTFSYVGNTKKKLDEYETEIFLDKMLTVEKRTLFSE